MSTGLVRKFSAPSCMARTAVGMSAVAGQQDDRGVPLAQVLQHLQAVHAGEPEIEDDHLRPQPVEGGQAGLAAQLAGDLVADPLEVVADAAQDIDVVIDKQYRCRPCEDYLRGLREYHAATKLDTLRDGRGHRRLRKSAVGRQADGR